MGDAKFVQKHFRLRAGVQIDTHALSLVGLGETRGPAGVGASGREVECLMHSHRGVMVVDLLRVTREAALEGVPNLARVEGHMSCADEATVILTGYQLQKRTFSTLRRSNDNAETTWGEGGRNVGEQIIALLLLEQVLEGSDERLENGVEFTVFAARLGTDGYVLQIHLNALRGDDTLDELEDFIIGITSGESGSKLFLRKSKFKYIQKRRRISTMITFDLKTILKLNLVTEK